MRMNYLKFLQSLKKDLKEKVNLPPKTQFKNLKTPEKSNTLAFFFISNLQCSNNVNSM